MTAPEPGTQDLAEKVAPARVQRMGGDWGTLDRDVQKNMTEMAQHWLDAIRAAGLVVVELPEPDGWAGVVGDDGEDTRTPYWRTSWNESVTAWIEGVETPVWSLREDLDEIRADALKMLAAVAACERYRAEQQGGDLR